MLMMCVLGWHMEEYPAQVMFVQPTRDSMRRFMTEKLWPMVAGNPQIRSKIDPKIVNTLAPTVINYSDGMVFTAWSGSNAMMRSATAEVVVADEVDLYKPTADYANALDMLTQRGEAYGDAYRLIVASTPVDESESIIEAEYDAGTAFVWLVPCPHCSLEHEIEWENVVKLRLYCPGCGAEIDERQRLAIIEAGYWKSKDDTKDPDGPNRSFHLSQLYSQFQTLEATAKRLNEDGSNLRSFTTQVLAKAYSSTVKKERAVDYVDLLFRDSTETVPPTAVTIAVDVQKDRLEAQVMHWWGLLPRVHQHRIFSGASWDMNWLNLSGYLRMHDPDIVFIDRGYKTVEVRTAVESYLSDFIRYGIVRLIRGSQNPDYVRHADLVHKRETSARPYDLELDTNVAKEMLHEMIVSQGITFNVSQVPDDFAAQITCEELRMVMRGMKEVPRWIKRHSRAKNEALDCAVYNICARYYLGVEYVTVDRSAVRGKLLDLMG